MRWRQAADLHICRSSLFISSAHLPAAVETERSVHVRRGRKNTALQPLTHSSHGPNALLQEVWMRFSASAPSKQRWQKNLPSPGSNREQDQTAMQGWRRRRRRRRRKDRAGESRKRRRKGKPAETRKKHRFPRADGGAPTRRKREKRRGKRSGPNQTSFVLRLNTVMSDESGQVASLSQSDRWSVTAPPHPHPPPSPPNHSRSARVRPPAGHLCPLQAAPGAGVSRVCGEGGGGSVFVRPCQNLSLCPSDVSCYTTGATFHQERR